MKNTLIVTRNEDVATDKAIELFRTNKGGIFFSRKKNTEDLVSIMGKSFATSIVTDCSSYNEVRQKIENTTTEVQFIVLDFIQLFKQGSIAELMTFLNEKDIKLIAVAWVNKEGQIREISNENISGLFENIIKFI